MSTKDSSSSEAVETSCLPGRHGISVSTMIVVLLQLFAWILHPADVFSSTFTDPVAVRLAGEIRTAAGDSLRIEKLAALAYYCSDCLADQQSADSLGSLAIRIAERSHRPELLFLAYSLYIESNPFHNDHTRVMRYALRAAEIAGGAQNAESMSRAYRNLASACISDYQFDQALSYSYKLLSIAGSIPSASRQASAYMLIGQSLEGRNQKIEAFRNYLQAMSIASELNDRVLKTEVCEKLSAFYNLAKLPDNAIRYKLMQQDLIRGIKPVDSIALMWTFYDLQAIDLNAGKPDMDEAGMREVLDFARRHGQVRLLNYMVGLLRTYYVETGKIGLLRDLYLRQLPGAFAKLAVSDPGQYYRLKAFFSEYDNKPDSARYYFNRAESVLAEDPNLILKSKFYARFGQFLLRHDDKEAAIGKFTRSYELAQDASFMEYMLNASAQLESLYAGKNDFRNAYKWAAENKILDDSIRNISKKDQLLVMEIDHETRERERAAVLEEESAARRHYLQYMAMIIGILTVFVILIMLGSLRVHEWIIRWLGFFSFIFLFEFIVLLADEKIHALTHGEPWKVLLIKIFLIAILLPMHHNIEKRVITYLLNHQLLDVSRIPVFRKAGGRAVKKAAGHDGKV